MCGAPLFHPYGSYLTDEALVLYDASMTARGHKKAAESREKETLFLCENRDMHKKAKKHSEDCNGVLEYASFEVGP